ncbi:MAG: FHA domain-containing protein [Gammaproteobacteria bacterium]
MGFGVAPEHVVTSLHALDDRDRITVRVPGTNAETAATVVYAEPRAGFALLRAPGLTTPPVTFAKDPASQGQAVATVASIGNMSKVTGAVGTLRDLPGRGAERRLRLFEHNAMIAASGYGAPVVNECGELIGMNRPHPDLSGRAWRRAEAPQGSVVALSAADLEPTLGAQGLQVNTAPESCATAAQRADAAITKAQEAEKKSAEAATLAEKQAEQAKQAEAQAQKAEQAAAAAKSHAAQLARHAQQLAAEKAASEADKLAAAQLAEAAKTAAQNAELALADARREASKQQAALADANNALAQTHQELDAALASAQEIKDRASRMEQEAADRFRGLAAAAGAFLLLLLAVWAYMSQRKRRQLAEVQGRAAAAERAAADAARIASEAVRAAPFDCVLQGQDREGRRILLKIPALALGDRAGVVIGRNPRNAEFLIDHDEISREHARLVVHGGSLHVEDLGTTNGTRVDGRSLRAGEAAALSHGSTLELGPLVLRVSLT